MVDLVHKKKKKNGQLIDLSAVLQLLYKTKNYLVSGVTPCEQRPRCGDAAIQLPESREDGGVRGERDTHSMVYKAHRQISTIHVPEK